MRPTPHDGPFPRSFFFTTLEHQRSRGNMSLTFLSDSAVKVFGSPGGDSSCQAKPHSLAKKVEHEGRFCPRKRWFGGSVSLPDIVHHRLLGLFVASIFSRAQPTPREAHMLAVFGQRAGFFVTRAPVGYSQPPFAAKRSLPSHSTRLASVSDARHIRRPCPNAKGRDRLPQRGPAPVVRYARRTVCRTLYGLQAVSDLTPRPPGCRCRPRWRPR